VFWDSVALDYRVMSLEEFLEFMKPKDCIIPKDIVPGQCKDYLERLYYQKRCELVEKGLYHLIPPPKPRPKPLDSSSVDEEQSQRA